jgi:multidrug resistance protein, MATE family
VMGLIIKIMKLSFAGALIVFLFLNIFSGTYLSIYGQDEAFLKLGIPVLRVVALAMLFMSIGTIWLNSVTGTGNGRMTFIIELVAIIAYCTYVYVVLEMKRLSIIWGWASELLYWTILFSLSFSYIKSNRWRKTSF